MNHDIFISYSSKNQRAAEDICQALERNGIKCWMAPRDIPMGSKYATIITQAIKSAKAVVLVFSKYSAISPWVESEINIAFTNRRPIIPYKIETLSLEDYDEFYLMLNNRHWIESVPDYNKHLEELITMAASIAGVQSNTNNERANDVDDSSADELYQHTAHAELNYNNVPDGYFPSQIEYMANFNEGANAIGGKLIITPDKIIFKAHRLNFGNLSDRIFKIQDVAGYRKGILTYLYIQFKDGREIKLAVWKKQEIITEIENRRKQLIATCKR